MIKNVIVFDDPFEDLVCETRSGPVLLTKSRALAAEFEKAGRCVIGLVPEEEICDIDFPEAAALVPEEDGGVPLSFVYRTACHFYGVPFTVARTDRLVIRESIGEDYPVIFGLLQECAAGTEGGARVFSEGFDLAEFDTQEKFMEYVTICYQFFGFGFWTVLRREEEERDAKIIGWCGLLPDRKQTETGFHVELGYMLTPESRRKGLGYEACRAILDYAQQELGLKEILLKTDAGNAASVALARKLGFTQAAPSAEPAGVQAGAKETLVMRLAL